MSRCVPNWEIEEQPNSSRGLPLNSTSVTPTAVATAANIGSRTDYEVAELTWVDGHPSMHGLGQHRLGKSMPKCPSPASWGKAIAGGAGTLESVVDQATGAILFPSAQSPTASADYDLVPWITPSQPRNCSSAPTASVSAIVMDALVPCANRANGLIDDNSTRVPEPPNGGGCDVEGRKRRRDENCSVSGSEASLGLPFDTCDINGGGDNVGFTTSTSPIDCSPDTENTSCGRAVTVADEHDSASHSRRSQREGEGEEKRKAGNLMRSSISTKRSRAAAVHNQSERKRRDRINQRMKTLQKLVPNSSKTDKASMLDEVIDYLKQLQAQVQMMNRMNTIPQMMMPMPMQQLQMTMMAQMTQMAQMGMGMGMAMGMDMNMNTSLARPSNQHPTPVTTPQLIQPSAFFPFVNPLWDGSGDRQSQVAGSVLPVDPLSAFMTCQAQKNPMTMDAFGRMASMYQQLYQQPSQQNPNPNLKQQ